jgi:hypothetical protein
LEIKIERDELTKREEREQQMVAKKLRRGGEDGMEGFFVFFK